MLDLFLLVLCAVAGFFVAAGRVSRAHGDTGSAVMAMLGMFGAFIVGAILLIVVACNVSGDHVFALRVGVFLVAYAASILLLGKRS